MGRLSLYFFVLVIFLFTPLSHAGAAPWCGTFMNQLNTFAERIPYFYLLPYPRTIDRLDEARVESAKQNYLDKFKENAKIESPQSNEEKIALLEATENFMRQNQNTPLSIERLRGLQQKRLSKLLAQWKPGERLSLNTFRKIMDLTYLAANSSLYRLKNAEDIFQPGSAVEQIVRSRWEFNFLKDDLKEALVAMNIVSPKESTWEKIKENTAVTAYWSLNIALNIQSFAMFGFPFFFPSFDTLAAPPVEKNFNNTRNQADGYSQFLTETKNFALFDYYSKWTKKFFPVLVAGAITLTTANVTANVNHQQAEFNRTSVVTVSNLPTRDQLEVLAKKEMVKEFITLNHVNPSPQQLEGMDHAIKSMRLRDVAQTAHVQAAF